jgi:AcrR family transcriptional regulator
MSDDVAAPASSGPASASSGPASASSGPASASSGPASASSGPASADLSAGVRAAWGLPGRPAKGPKPVLSLNRIVEAAVRVAQTDGLPAVSMSKVAAEVGVTAMALYRHVGGKDELLALMVDAAMGDPPDVPRRGQGWREGLSAWAWAENAVYRAHPWTLRVPIQGISTLPNQTRWLEQALRCLTGSGLSEEAKLSSILLVSNLVRGYATIGMEIDAAMAGTDPSVVMAGYVSMMNQLLDPARFPALRAALDSGTLAKADPTDQELAFGLERVLDGLEALIG